MSEAVKPLSGRRIFLYFFAFFGVIVAVNSVFISNALKTHSVLVIEQAYEKGLSYNETLDAARNQPDIEHKASYEAGVLRWVLPMQNAKVSAKIKRKIKDGHDFDIALYHVGGGVYEALPEFPMTGAWTAHLKAVWNNKTFQTRHDLIAR